MATNNCDNVVFTAPKATIGGTKKVPSCMPTPATSDEIQYTPNADAPQSSKLSTPTGLVIGNDFVVLDCEEGSIGASAKIATMTLTSVIYMSSAGITESSVLHYIAENKLEDWLEDAIRNDSITVSDVVTMTKLTYEDATALLTLGRTTRSELTASAITLAESMLDCYWLNEAQTATCSDPDHAATGEHPDAVHDAVVAAGVYSSKLSQYDANEQARLAAEAMLVCLYVSDPYRADCTERDGWDTPEAVPVDLVAQAEGLDLRVGYFYVASGMFSSYASKEDANLLAENYALAQLNCFYINEERYAECEDQNARAFGAMPYSDRVAGNVVDGTNGQYVTVPYGLVTSLVNTADANVQADALAAGVLECCYVNERMYAECGSFTYVDDDGETHTVPYSQTESPTYEVEIAAGTFTSCESQEAANAQAEAAMEGVLECYYCNEIVLPTCVPEWVINAADGGIMLDDGTIFTLDLPLNLEELATMSNPYTGEPVDISTWSVDATLGMPASVYCSDVFSQSQQIAESAGIETLQSTKATSCRFENDLYVAACAAEDPYTNGTPSGEAYTFYSKFEYGSCISDALSNPSSGQVIEIPAGLFSVSAEDTPGTLSESDAGYSADYNDLLTKAYANQLAEDMALSLLTCVFANPYSTGVCGSSNNSVALCANIWNFSGGAAVHAGESSDYITWRYGDGSNTDGNPLIVPAGMFTSSESIEEVYAATKSYILNALICVSVPYVTFPDDLAIECNDEVTEDCQGSSGQGTPIKESVTIAADTICIAGTKLEANDAAKELAKSMLICDAYMVYWNAAVTKTCKGSGSGMSLPFLVTEVTIPANTFASTSDDDAKEAAEAMAEMLLMCEGVIYCNGEKEATCPDGPSGGNTTIITNSSDVVVAEGTICSFEDQTTADAAAQQLADSMLVCVTVYWNKALQICCPDSQGATYKVAGTIEAGTFCSFESAEDADDKATALAESVMCAPIKVYYNNEVVVECQDTLLGTDIETAAWYSHDTVAVTQRASVTVPANTTVSTMSQCEADSMAEAIGRLSLICKDDIGIYVTAQGWQLNGPLT